MGDFLTALALVFVIEGALYALFPNGMKRMMRTAEAMPSESLRTGGLLAAGAGIAALWLLRG